MNWRGLCDGCCVMVASNDGAEDEKEEEEEEEEAGGGSLCSQLARRVRTYHTPRF